MSSRRGKLLEREDLAGDIPGSSTDVSSRLGGLSGCRPLPGGCSAIVGRAPPVAFGSLPTLGDRAHSSSSNGARDSWRCELLSFAEYLLEYKSYEIREIWLARRGGGSVWKLERRYLL